MKDRKGPQLSGTLFTIVINGIFEGIETTIGKYVYADDLVLFYTAKASAVSYTHLDVYKRQ